MIGVGGGQRHRFRIQTLHTKFFLVVALLACLLGAVALLIQARSFRETQLAMTQALNTGLASTIAQDQFSSISSNRQRQSEVRSGFSRLMSVNPAIEIYLLDVRGKVEAFTAPDEQVKRTSISLGPVRQFLTGRFPYPLLGDDPKDTTRSKIFSAALLNADKPELGFLYVILSGAEVDTMGRRLQPGLLLDSALLAISLAVALGLATAFFVAALLTRKLRHLAKAINEVRDAGFQGVSTVAVAEAPRGDEIDRLGRAYNSMIMQIRDQLGEIARATSARRELIENISHDLRTPLASLRGYIETMLMKDAVLSAEERRRYLDIASRQSRRIDRLIDELFDLAKLDEMEGHFEVEPFQLSELVQDVIQKFHLIATEKGVLLEGEFMPDASLVNADIALVERMLDNLLDNAIRQTPRDGRVVVSVAMNGEDVRLTVADTGCGIPMGDVPRIFDRFYRVDPSRNPLSGGAGLGLAIVKRIVELHRGRIAISSEMGVGTTFRIDLRTTRPALLLIGTPFR